MRGEVIESAPFAKCDNSSLSGRESAFGCRLSAVNAKNEIAHERNPERAKPSMNCLCMMMKMMSTGSITTIATANAWL